MNDFLSYWHFCVVHDWEEHLLTLAIGMVLGAFVTGFGVVLLAVL